MHRVTDLADPNRCKGAAPEGQCLYLAMTGSEYCKAHGGSHNKDLAETQSYLLTQADYKRRLAQLQVQSEPIRELKDAIALTHMLIEKRFNLIKDDNDLLAACGPLNALLLTMERLVKSAITLEQNLGALLAKPTVLNLGQTIVTIIIDELAGVEGYEDRVDRITSRMLQSISLSANTEAK